MKATTKASALTTLKWGQVEIAVGLFSTVATPGKLQTFDTAGPNGGVLKAQQVARATPVAEAVEMPAVDVIGDPFADVLTTEADVAVARTVTVDGQYGRELVEEGSGVVVSPENVRKGVRLEDGSFLDCTAQLAQIDADTKLDCAEIVAFVGVSRVPRARVKGAQYVGAADEKAPRSLRLLLEAMKSTKRVAVVKLTKRSRQTLGVIGWLDGSLVLYELVFAEDFREPPARVLKVSQALVTDAEVAVAVRLVEAMGDSISALDELRDDAVARREQLRADALAGVLGSGDVVDAEVVDEQAEMIAQLEATLAQVSG